MSMKKWTTIIKAVDHKDGKLKEFIGPVVPGSNWSEAEIYCQENGLGYCEVRGELVEEIDEAIKTFKSVWTKKD